MRRRQRSSQQVARALSLSRSRCTYVELTLGLGESRTIRRVNQKHNRVGTHVVVRPNATSCTQPIDRPIRQTDRLVCERAISIARYHNTANNDHKQSRTLLVASEIKCTEANVIDRELLRCCTPSERHSNQRVRVRVRVRLVSKSPTMPPYPITAIAQARSHGSTAHTRMECGRMLRQTVVSQHMHQRRLACIVETEEQDLGILLVQPCVYVAYKTKATKRERGGRGRGGWLVGWMSISLERASELGPSGRQRLSRASMFGHVIDI